MRRATGSTLVVVLLLGLAWVLPAPALAADADLVVTKTADQARVVPGRTVGYEITLRNTSDTGLTVATVTDDLPEGFVYVAGSTGGGMVDADPVVSGQALEWAVDYPLPEGEAATLTFEAYTVAAEGTWTNSASATAGSRTVQPTGPTAPVETAYPAMELYGRAGDESVGLEWSSGHPDVDRYQLFYQQGTTPPARGSGTEVPLAPGATDTQVAGLANSTTYAFSVFALDPDGAVLQSSTTTATPMLPPVEDLRATGAGSGAMLLTWRNPDRVTEAVVRYSTSGYPATPTSGTAVPGPHVDSATVAGLSNGSQYYVSVFARRGTAYSEAAERSFVPFACPTLAPALDAPAGLVTGSRWLACAAAGAHRGDSTLDTPLPRTGTQAVMTTGDVSVALPPSDGDAEGAAHGSTLRGAYDVAIHRIDLQVPEGSRCLAFDYAFATDEFPNNIGNGYDDAFVAELDANTWSVDGTEIDAPDNFALTDEGERVSVDGGLFANPAQVSGPAQSGTGYGGFSQPLRASTPVTPGPHSLYLSVFDVTDDFTDSAVFLDRLSVSNSPCGEEAVPTELSIGVDRARVDWPARVGVSGTLSWGGGAVPLAGREVSLWAQPAGGAWAQVGTTQSDAAGRVSLTHRPDRATAYQWRTAGLTSTAAPVKVRPALTAQAPAKVKRNRNLVVRGASTPVDAGDTVQLQRKVKKRWQPVTAARFRSASTATSGGTAYRLVSRMRTTGKLTFRVAVPAQSGRLAVATKPFVVKVTR